MRIDAFLDADEFKSQVDEYVRVFRATRPAPGTSGPLLPGDPEREAEQVRRKEGVPLLSAVVKDLLDISEKIGVPLADPD
jgi:LDH2 family malate/lactate/ureidoglycolate dehydrogenase